jgi:hypothetical protein
LYGVPDPSAIVFQLENVKPALVNVFADSVVALLDVSDAIVPVPPFELKVTV